MSKPVAKSAAAKKASTGPSYEAMIKEAILAHPEEARSGLSRPTIKKFIHQKYPASSKLSEAAFNNHISKAIAKGSEKKVFSLPKGPSGKVKLAPSVKKTATKKPAAKKTATAKPAAKKVKKTTTTAKKPAAKKTKSSTATKAKKPVAKKTATKKKVAPKKAAPKKA